MTTHLLATPRGYVVVRVFAGRLGWSAWFDRRDEAEEFMVRMG